MAEKKKDKKKKLSLKELFFGIKESAKKAARKAKEAAVVAAKEAKEAYVKAKELDKKYKVTKRLEKFSSEVLKDATIKGIEINTSVFSGGFDVFGSDKKKEKKKKKENPFDFDINIDLPF